MRGKSVTRVLAALLGWLLLAWCSWTGAAPARQAAAGPPPAGTTVLRMATLAPEGTEWADAAREASRRVREETGGRVELKWYLGAVMGDESTMMARLREGKLEGGVFSMMSLAREVPSMAFLGLPFLFRDLNEAREISGRLGPLYRERFRNRGLRLLGSFSLGFGRLFTGKPAPSLEALTGLRTWTWKGDALGRSILETLGFRDLVPLEMTDVLPALQYGMLDAFSGTCYTISVLQWFPYARYVVPLNWAYTFGGIVLRADAFSGMSAQDRERFAGVISVLLGRMQDESIRKEEEAARILAASEGMQTLRLPREDVARLERRAEALYGIVAREQGESALMQEILQALDALRDAPAKREGLRPPAPEPGHAGQR